MHLPNTKRVAKEPPMLAGLTSPEFTIVAVIGLLSMPITIALFLFSFPGLGIKVSGIALIGAFFVSVVVRNLIVKSKRSRPEGFYQQRMMLFIEQLTNRKQTLQKESHWDYLRHK